MDAEFVGLIIQKAAKGFVMVAVCICLLTLTLITAAGFAIWYLCQHLQWVP